MVAGPINILLVEDDPAAAKLLLDELRRGGLEFTHTVVDCESAYSAALKGEPDLVLCGWGLPGLGSSRALALLGELSAVPPLIIVAGAIGEEAVAQLIKEGASDYVCKDRLGRLGPTREQEHRLPRAGDRHVEQRREGLAVERAPCGDRVEQHHVDAAALERGIERLLMQSRQSDVPCHLHLI